MSSTEWKEQLVQRELRRMAIGEHSGSAQFLRLMCVLSGFALYIMAMIAMAFWARQWFEVFFPRAPYVIDDLPKLFRWLFPQMALIVTVFLPSLYGIRRVDQWQSQEYEAELLRLQALWLARKAEHQ